MPDSLTREEFLNRFRRRRRLFQLALMEDIKAVSPLRCEVPRDGAEIIGVDITEPIGKLIGKIINRVIDLVYEEGLD